MKVLVLSHQSNKSGAARFLLNIFPGISKKVEVVVVLNQYQEAADEFRQKLNTKYFFLEPLKKVRYFLMKFKIFNYLKIWWFKKFLKKTNPDLIYVNTAAFNILSDYVVRNNKFPYMVHVHEAESFFEKHPKPSALKSLMENATSVIGCAHYITTLVSTRFSIKQTTTIYEAIDISRFENIVKNEFRKKYLNNNFQATLVGVTGAPQYRKATDVFIKAAIRFNQQNPENNFVFVWLGGSEVSNNNDFYRSCQELIHISGWKNILLINQIDNVGSFYADLDLFVIPSREDPFPLSMLEAMYFKVPVIGSNVSGIPEALSDDCGFLFESENETQLCSVLENFYKDPMSFERTSINSYQKFMQNFTKEAVEPRVLELILN